MSFDPLDPTTWHDDPEDFITPPHKDAHIAATASALAESDAGEAEQVRSFYECRYHAELEQNMEDIDTRIIEARKALRDAVNTLQDAEGMLDADAARALQDSADAMGMTDDDVAEEMQRRAGWDQEEV